MQKNILTEINNIMNLSNLRRKQHEIKSLILKYANKVDLHNLPAPSRKQLQLRIDLYDKLTALIEKMEQANKANTGSGTGSFLTKAEREHLSKELDGYPVEFLRKIGYFNARGIGGR